MQFICSAVDEFSVDHEFANKFHISVGMFYLRVEVLELIFISVYFYHMSCRL